MNIESVEHVSVIVDTLSKIFYRAQPMEQCAILKSLTTMYTNLVSFNKIIIVLDYAKF